MHCVKEASVQGLSQTGNKVFSVMPVSHDMSVNIRACRGALRHLWGQSEGFKYLSDLVNTLLVQIVFTLDIHPMSPSVCSITTSSMLGRVTLYKLLDWIWHIL